MYRSIALYDPYADAAERWPDWRIVFTPLAGITAVYSTERQLFLLDADYWAGREDEGVARVVAHLDLGHHHGAGGFTDCQVAFARTLAQLKLDRQEYRG